MATVGVNPAAPKGEEDVQKKKSTDCIYYLASPLTCKKGGECEYRHSDAARNNPRECRFWLTSGCLNQNCSFRHPRLDETRAQSVQQASGKAPCYFFAQGYCAKGDRCAFFHARPAAPVLRGPKPVPAPTPLPPVQTKHADPKSEPTKPEVAGNKKLPEKEGVKPPQPHFNASLLTKSLAAAIEIPKKQPAVPQSRIARNGAQVAHAQRVRDATTQHVKPSVIPVRHVRAVTEERKRSPEQKHDSELLVDNASEQAYRDFEVQRSVYRSGVASRNSAKERSYGRPGLIDYERPIPDDIDYTQNGRSVSISDRLTHAQREARSLNKNDLRNLLKRRRTDTDTTDANRLSLRETPVMNKQIKRTERPAEVAAGNGVSYKSRIVDDSSPPPYATKDAKFSSSSDSDEFDAPKSLAEIKASKRKFDNEEDVSFGKRKRSTGSGSSEEVFEAPKPLRELLKEKRKAEVPQVQSETVVKLPQEEKGKEVQLPAVVDVVQEKSKPEAPEVQTRSVEEVKAVQQSSSAAAKQTLVIANGAHIPVEEHVYSEPMEMDDLYDEDDEFMKKLNSYLNK